MKMKNMNKILYSALVIAMLAAIVWVIFVYADANMKHYNAHMEADIASETILADELFNNHHVQPDTWNMSTARRIIAAPMLASFLYPVTGYNMVPAMGLACTLMMLMMIASMLFFGRQIGFGLLENLVAVLLVLVLSSPADETQRMLFLYASYYVGHFISMFVVLGLYAGALKANKVTILTFIITIPLAIVNGIQGTHASMFFYLPLLGVEIIRRLISVIKKQKANNVITVWVFIIAVISYVFSKIFEFGVTSGVSRNIRHAPEKFIGEVLPSFISVLGYNRWEIVVILLVITAVAGFVIAFKKSVSDKGMLAVFPMILGIVVVLLSGTFTTVELAPRYFVLLVFVVAYGVAAMVKYAPNPAIAVSVVVLAYAANSAVAFYDGLIRSDSSADSEYVQITDWMKESGYEYGYSTFDHSNPMTVMSYGEVKVRPVESFSTMHGLKWLSDSRWYPPYKDSGSATCYVVSHARTEEFGEFLAAEKPVIIDEKEFSNFTVYVTDRDYSVWVD